MIPQVYTFNREVLGLDDRQEVLPLDLPERDWLAAALREEIEELLEARNLAEEVDALIDLCYFAIGGMVRLGLTEMQATSCFEAVHNANMTKKIGVKETRPNDGSVADAVKDESFQDPTYLIKEILGG